MRDGGKIQAAIEVLRDVLERRTPVKEAVSRARVRETQNTRAARRTAERSTLRATTRREIDTKGLATLFKSCSVSVKGTPRLRGAGKCAV